MRNRSLTFSVDDLKVDFPGDDQVVVRSFRGTGPQPAPVQILLLGQGETTADRFVLRRSAEVTKKPSSEKREFGSGTDEAIGGSASTTENPIRLSRLTSKREKYGRARLTGRPASNLPAHTDPSRREDRGGAFQKAVVWIHSSGRGTQPAETRG